MKPKCIFVGEAWGKDEANYEFPFIGASGQELYRMLCQTGIISDNLDYRWTSPLTMMNKWMTQRHPILNVFNERPGKESNSVELFYARPRDKVSVAKQYGMRKFGQSNYYVREDKAHHVERLHKTLKEKQPNLIVAHGATACWALGLGASIGKLRGFVHSTPFGKVLPVYHPAAVLRNWSLRVPTLLDLAKAKREMEYAEFRSITREIWTDPTIDDLWDWWEKFGKHSPLLSIDIETVRRQQISEFGVAASATQALHIPFLYEDKQTPPKVYRQFWRKPNDELKAWQFVKHVCECPTPKVGQNFKYDVYWLLKEMGISALNWQHDTMVAAHAWMPELGKSLYDLGAIFLDERSWKSIRKDTGKDND